MIKFKFELKGFDKPILPTGMAGKKFMETWGVAAVRTIRERVNDGFALPTSGKHIRSNATSGFVAYSKSYQDYKRSIGRRPGSAGDWLILTGQMLKALDVVFASPNKVIVGFWGSHTGEKPLSKQRARKRSRIAAGQKRDIKKMAKTRSGGIVGATEALPSLKQAKPIPHSYLAAINDRIRPFVGLTPKEVDKITNQAWVKFQFGSK
jgi:hypothetical protein